MNTIDVIDKDDTELTIMVQHIVAVAEAAKWGDVHYTKAHATLFLAGGWRVFTKDTQAEILDKIARSIA